MGNKVCSVLTVFFLCMAALRLEAVVRKVFVYYPYRQMSWEKARLHCQRAHVDLLPLHIVNALMPWRPYLGQQTWTGVVRHPEGARVWTEVSFKTGGLSGDNVSPSIRWDDGEPEPLCAFILKSDQMWYSDLCSNEKAFYCSFSEGIQYVKKACSWYNASAYCQERSGQLVSIDRFPAGSLTKTSWIGAYEENGTWSWVNNYTPFFANWAPNEPRSQDCALLNASSKKYHRALCSQKHSLLCLGDNLVVIKTSKTWEEALNHCLELKTCQMDQCEHPYNLLSLNESSDYGYIRDRIYRAATAEVWIGLRFLGGSWWWADGQALEGTWDLPSCPSDRNHCGTLSKHGTDKWNIGDCSEKRNFICYRKINTN